MKNKNKFFSFMFSFMPGAGQMYLGFLRQGVQLMLLFFLCFYLADWLGSSIFIIFAPVIWFFSFFDALNKASMEQEIEDTDLKILGWLKDTENWLGSKANLIGWVLIILGGFLLFDKIVLPQLGHEIREYLRIVIVAILLIGGGVKLIVGTKLPAKTEIEGEKYEKI